MTENNNMLENVILAKADLEERSKEMKQARAKGKPVLGKADELRLRDIFEELDNEGFAPFGAILSELFPSPDFKTGNANFTKFRSRLNKNLKSAGLPLSLETDPLKSNPDNPRVFFRGSIPEKRRTLPIGKKLTDFNEDYNPAIFTKPRMNLMSANQELAYTTPRFVREFFEEEAGEEWALLQDYQREYLQNLTIKLEPLAAIGVRVGEPPIRGFDIHGVGPTQRNRFWYVPHAYSA